MKKRGHVSRPRVGNRYPTFTAEENDETRTLFPDLEPRSLLGPIVGAEVGVSGEIS